MIEMAFYHSVEKIMQHVFKMQYIYLMPKYII